jgi:hypothetical protein
MTGRGRFIVPTADLSATSYPHKRLDTINVLWYHLPITHLLNAGMGDTSLKGGNSHVQTLIRV